VFDLIFSICLCLLEPKAGSVTASKPTLPAKVAPQKKQASSSDDSSSDFEDEKPAKVYIIKKRFWPYLNTITCSS